MSLKETVIGILEWYAPIGRKYTIRTIEDRTTVTGTMLTQYQFVSEVGFSFAMGVLDKHVTLFDGRIVPFYMVFTHHHLYYSLVAFGIGHAFTFPKLSLLLG
jgi:hypothetical protein